MSMKVKYTANENERTANIRHFVCRVHNDDACKNEDPLPTFNALLNWVVEQAFADGIAFGRKHPDIDVELNSQPAKTN